jgi:ATP-dependent helicase Lhr and Lhr-like helicase
LRLDAEDRLKKGELKALVATSSLELGIDIGSVDLVCQLGTTRSIATLLQRIGRAEHKRSGIPKGRLFPLTRDELVECVAMIRSIQQGVLDRLHIPQKPLDVLSQQIVAATACEDWDEEELFNLVKSAYPYRSLVRQEFDEVVRMLAEGFSTKRGRRGALIHRDGINHRIRGRRGARLVALTSGGAIPDNSDYRVVVEPSETFVGTVNEDFAVESMAGDIFQLGNASWKVLRINAGTVRVEDAHGQPPGIPFWLGEGPARTFELSQAVSDLREDIEKVIEQSGNAEEAVTAWLVGQTGISQVAAQQLALYFTTAYRALGVLPSQNTIVLERFFDESGGMQLVVHSPFGARVNRAWGLSLRKRFCRSFNFELQAAATDDAIVLSLGTQHSFPLDEVFRYLNSKTVRDLLVQAMLDSPMFPIRWRWNATRSLALPRQRGGHKIPAPLQRMESENLLAAVFPDQLACLENIAGDREVPDHPLVKQTIEDCLTEAMDIEGLETLLRRIEKHEVRCVALDLPEPSLLAHEILNARPYAFLDNAPLEERRTQAVYTRRASESAMEGGLGTLDTEAIARVSEEAWPRATNADELHEALLLAGVMSEEEIARCSPESGSLLRELTDRRRAGKLSNSPSFWIAAERLPMMAAVYPGRDIRPAVTPPDFESKRNWKRDDAIRELVRGRMEVAGPITAETLIGLLELPKSEIDTALIALEAEGFVLRGKFNPGVQQQEWCNRRLLARIHRLTLNRLRAEIQPVSLADFQRFLLAWQRAGTAHRVEGPEGVASVLELLDGYELPAAAWEPGILSLRVKDYVPGWLDRLCFTGRIGWGRLSAPQSKIIRAFAPLRSSPVSVFTREHLPYWLALAAIQLPELPPDTAMVLKALAESGALFFSEIVQRTKLLASRVEQALGELVTQGWVTADSFEGLRALLTPPEKRSRFGNAPRNRRHKPVTSVEFAGRWTLLRKPIPVLSSEEDKTIPHRDEAVEVFARTLLRRYGVMFRRLLERESFDVSWFDLGRVYRQLEARGEIRGGHFVNGVSGEQFALPDAIGMLRSIRRTAETPELVTLSAADPLNLIGILTPGPRVASTSNNRILLYNGTPIAVREAGKISRFGDATEQTDSAIERALVVGRMATALRPYYS